MVTLGLCIVSYVEIDLKDTGTYEMALIRELVIGPQLNAPEAWRSVKQFLAHHGSHDVEVRLSKVLLKSE
jgi:hypothetical protein